MPASLVEMNAPRWALPGKASAGKGWHEAWYVAGSDLRAGIGIWVRYTVDVALDGTETPALWGAWFDREHPERSFALRNLLPAAAISRTNSEGRAIAFGDAELSAGGCKGEVEAGGHSLRWRLAFKEGLPAEDVVPAFLRPVGALRQSGFILAHPATTLTGALEVDGKLVELRGIAAGQAHLWGRRRYPWWAWARCSAFAEDPGASLDLLAVEGPGGVIVPLYTFRYRGEAHRFGELPWITLSRSRAAAPTWHFSAEDATLAIDGVLHVPTERMVQVGYDDADGGQHHCINSELADLELRVRTRAFPGAPWRPEAALTSQQGACLEFCGRVADERVANQLVTAQRSLSR